MSGIKRKIEGNDPDYEDISLAQNSKRNKAAEHDGKMSLCSQHRNSTPALCNNYTVHSDIMSYIFFLCYSAREATVRKIETIIRQQFSLEMKNKEHEIDVISQVPG